MILQDRDYLILNEVYRWRICLGRHIKDLCNFEGVRATDRRLSKLLEAGYLERKKILYGIPGIYTLSYKGRILINVNKNKENIRVEQVVHDITVLDVACKLIKSSVMKRENIITDKQLHSLDGFAVRKHRPDFVINNKTRKMAVEIELSLKSKERLEQNVKDNYMNYENQFWFVPQNQNKIKKYLEEFKTSYSAIEIFVIEDVLKNG